MQVILRSVIHLYSTHLRCANFVERDKDGSVQEAAEGQISVKGPGGHQQQEELREEGSQAQTRAPPVVCTNRRGSAHSAQHSREIYLWVLFGVDTCTEVQHVEVRREVVSGVSSGEMVKIGVMEKLPTIPDQGVAGREMEKWAHDRDCDETLRQFNQSSTAMTSQHQLTCDRRVLRAWRTLLRKHRQTGAAPCWGNFQQIQRSCSAPTFLCAPLRFAGSERWAEHKWRGRSSRGPRGRTGPLPTTAASLSERYSVSSGVFQHTGAESEAQNKPVRQSKVASTNAAIMDSALPLLDTPMGRGFSSHREQTRPADWTHVISVLFTFQPVS